MEVLLTLRLLTFLRFRQNYTLSDLSFKNEYVPNIQQTKNNADATKKIKLMQFKNKIQYLKKKLH